MKKLYFLDEQERNRILNLHTEATKKQYLLDKKILNESIIPIKPIKDSKMLFNFFRKGGRNILQQTTDDYIDDFLKQTFDKRPGVNKVVAIIDDVFNNSLKNKNWYDITFSEKLTDNTFKTYLKTTRDTPMDLEKFKQYLNIFKGSNPTKQEMKDFLDSFPKGFKTNPIMTGKLVSDNIELYDDLVLKLKAEFPDLFREGMSPSTIRKAGYITAISAAIATPTIIISNWSLSQTKRGEDREVYSKALMNDIKTECPKRTNPTSGDTGLSTIANTIWGAGYMDAVVYGATDEDLIKNQLENLGNIDNFCRMVKLFDKTYGSNRIISNATYMSKGIQQADAFTKFMDYEFTGVFRDPSSYYYNYVIAPIKGLLNDTKKKEENEVEEKKVEGSEKPSGSQKSGGDSDNCLNTTKNDNWKCLVKNFPVFASFSCLEKYYMDYKGSKKIWNVPGTGGAIQIGTEYYQDGIIIGPDKTTKIGTFICQNDNLVKQ